MQKTVDPKKKPEKKHAEFLKYTFGDDELREIAKDLARENQEAETIDREKAQVVSAFKTRLTVAQAKIAKFSAWIREGADWRMIDCITRFHNPEQGERTTVRLDTGEVVRTVRMSIEEMQDDLSFED